MNSKEQKMKSSSFAMSMNAVEGVFASEETQKGIVEWQCLILSTTKEKTA